jgi:hypothetical protein
MLKTLFATTALASVIAWGAQAQSQTEPETEPPVNQMAPAADEDAGAAPMEADTADTEMAPADAGTDTEMAQPEAPAAPEADTEMAQPEAPAAPEADTDMAQPETPPEPDTDVAQPETAPATGTDTEMAEPEAPATAEPATEMAEPATPPLDEGWSQVDVATISADTLIGTDIRTYDQETVASVEDVMMTADGMVEGVVARFGGFLGFGENTVLLNMDEVSVVQDADGNVVVLTNLTPDALKDRPEYVPEDQQG